jgi:small GTP-binding protein
MYLLIVLIYINFLDKHVFVDEYDPTIEDAYRPCRIVDGVSHMLEIIDTSGMDEYTAMRDMYLRNCDCMIIVLSMDYLVESIQMGYDLLVQTQKLKELQDLKDVPAVIAFTKMDVIEHIDYNYWIDVITKEFNCDNEYSYMRDNYSYVEVSSKNRTNVDHVFEESCRLIGKTVVELTPPKAKKTKQICTFM